jgi:hypothetical protein
MANAGALPWCRRGSLKTPKGSLLAAMIRIPEPFIRSTPILPKIPASNPRNVTAEDLQDLLEAASLGTAPTS